MSTITLPNIRVSSDLTVKVRLKDSGVAIDWSTLTKIKASIYSDAQRALAGRCDVSIDAEDSTLLVCSYAANKPQYVGVNRIVVSAKYMGETKTYDKPAFTFVRWTADQEGEEITIDDPEVDVEIDVEDISSSILQEAVDAAFTAADRANDAAAAAEHMVDIHTGPEGKSAYEVAVEEGYTGTEEEWLASLVGPQGAQGIQGETGEAAGFGTVSVSLQEDGGQPSATVAASGTDTAKNFAFTFNNLKGDKGDKGDQGNSGYTGAAGELEVVNNLTDGGAAKALSAEMGKTLEGEVSQLEHKVTDFEDAVLEQIEDYKPIIIEGDVTNAPDEEDITTDENNLLKFANRSALYGLGYTILRRDKTIAQQVTLLNTIYEVRYDFDLTQDLVLPSGCRLFFNGGTINPNGHTISGAIANEYIMPEWFGAKGDGVTDDSDAFNAVVALVNGGSNGRISLQKKHYLIKNQLAFRNDIDIIGNGATLDFQKDGMFACVEISKETPFSALNAGTISGTKGESTITVSDASEMSSGDFVILYDTTADSWSSESNRDYHCGDIFKVVSVNGTTIGVSEPLTQDYSGASIVLYKLQTIKASISDLCVIGDFVDGSNTKTLTPILARCCVESSFKNLYLTNSSITHLALIYCYGVVVDNVKVDTDSTTTNVNTNYGITVGCCKKVDVGNCVLKSSRHGLTIGGGETLCFPNRYILVHDCIFDTYGTVTNAVDSHGNAEYITFTDNVIIGGITCSASNFLIKGNRIFSKKGLQAGIYLANARYRTGTIQDNEIHWYASANGDCGISIYTNSDADNDAELLIDGNRFFIDAVNAELTSQCADIYFRNGTTYKYKRLIISNNVFHYGTFNLCIDFFASNSLADYLVFERNECRDIVQLNQTAGISESIIQDNNFEKLGGSCLTINNGGTKTTIKKNHFVTNNYAITFGGTTQNTNTIFIVDGNFFDITMAASGRAAVNSSKSGKTVFVNNTVYSPTVGGASLYLNDIYATNSAELVCKSNKFYVASKVQIYDATTVTTVKRDTGGTAGRNAMLPGDTYFDTDLGKMIVWNGTAWVNMDGTALS